MPYPNINSELYVGAIADDVGYVGGCYVHGLTVNIHLSYQQYTYPNTEIYPYLHAAVGGIAGEATYVDVCYAENVSLNITQTGEGKTIKLHAGCIAGRATSCLSCWASGEIQVNGDGYQVLQTNDIVNCPVGYMTPVLLTEEQFGKMTEKLTAYYGKDSFEDKLVRCFFFRREECAPRPQLSDREREAYHANLQRCNDLYSFLHPTEEIHNVLYEFVTPTTSSRDYECVGKLLVESFGSESAYLDFCARQNIKVGTHFCYAYTPDAPAVTQEEAIGFDFTTIWTCKDGRPRLKMFYE